MSSKQRLSLIVLLPTLFVFLLGLRTLSNSSAWLHLSVGRSIVQSGLAASPALPYGAQTDKWINANWLYDWLVFHLWQAGGATALILVHAFCAAAALFIVSIRGRQIAGPVGAGAAILISGWLWAPQLIPSPFLLAAPILAVFLVTMSAQAISNRQIVGLALLQLIWVNLHGSFVLAPLLAAVSALQVRGERSQEGGDPVVQRLVLVAVLLLLTLANPYGIRLPALSLQGLYSAHGGTLPEWISPFASQFRFPYGGYLVTLVLAIVASGFIFVRQKLPLLVTTVAVIGAFLLVRAHVYSCYAALLTLPFVALSLASIGRTIPERLPWRAAAARWALVAAVLVSAAAVASNAYYRASGSASHFGVGIQRDAFPSATLTSLLDQLPPDTALVNLPVDGGYLAWTRPGARIFCDIRSDLYGPTFYDELQRWLMGQPEAAAAFENHWKPGAVLVNCTWPGAPDSIRSLIAGGAWALAYFDGTSALLLKGRGRIQLMTGNAAAQKAGLAAIEAERRQYQARVAKGCPGPNSTRLMGAGAIFHALGQFREAENILNLVTKASPRYTAAWRDLCNSRIGQGRVQDALPLITRRDGPLTPSAKVWLWVNLERLYRMQGKASEADAAIQSARDINAQLANFYSSTNAQIRTGNTMAHDLPD